MTGYTISISGDSNDTNLVLGSNSASINDNNSSKTPIIVPAGDMIFDSSNPSDEIVFPEITNEIVFDPFSELNLTYPVYFSERLNVPNTLFGQSYFDFDVGNAFLFEIDTSGHVVAMHDHPNFIFKAFLPGTTTLAFEIDLTLGPDHTNVPINPVSLMPAFDATTRVVTDPSWVDACGNYSRPNNIKAAVLSSNYTYSIAGVGNQQITDYIYFGGVVNGKPTIYTIFGMGTNTGGFAPLSNLYQMFGVTTALTQSDIPESLQNHNH